MTRSYYSYGAPSAQPTDTAENVAEVDARVAFEQPCARAAAHAAPRHPNADVRTSGRVRAASQRVCVNVHPGNFSLIYESSDGRLCVFETRDGHVTAVDAARLA